MISLPNFKKANNGNETQKPVVSVFQDIFSIEIDKDEIRVGLYSEKEGKIQNIYNALLAKNDYNFETSLLEEEIVNRVKEEIQKTKELYPTKSKNLVLGISQRNVISFTTTVRIKRINPELKITKKEVDDFVTKIVNNSKAEILPETNSNLELLNTDIIFTKVDGYITKTPEGMRGTTLEISIFINFVNAEYLEDLISFSNKIGLDLVTIATGIYAFNKSLENNMDSNYLLIDIDSSTTNLGVVFAGELFYGTYVSFGLRDLKNYLMGKFNITEIEAENIITEKTVDEQMINAKNSIYDYFYELISVRLQTAKRVKVLPESIKIIGKKSKFVDKKLLLKNLSSLNFKDEPTITTVNNEIFTFYDETIQKLPKSSFIKNLALSKFCLKILEHKI